MSLTGIQTSTGLIPFSCFIDMTVLPTPSANLVGKIYQYTGNTTQDYINGYFYQCVENNGVYSWIQKDVQDAAPPSLMTGATASVAGTAGLVPPPQVGDEGKVLKGDGSWGEVSGGSTVSVSHTGTASSSGVRKQQITVDGVATDVDGSAYMEQSVNTSTSAAVTATFTNSAITANSAIDVYTSQQGLDYSTMTISAGSCTVTFPAQASAASVTVRIYIR